MIKINPRFNCGDSVYLILDTYKSKKHKCVSCKGVGSVVQNSCTFTCERCYGKGEFDKKEVVYKVIEKPAIVRTVLFSGRVHNKKSIVEISCTLDSDFSNTIAANDRHIGRAMLIGIDERQLFSTLQDAQKRCDELNSEK